MAPSMARTSRSFSRIGAADRGATRMPQPRVDYPPRMFSTKISPFLWFNDNAEEAVAFYTSIFPNSRTGLVTRYGDVGPMPKGMVMTISFDIGGQNFTAMNGGPMVTFNESVSFVVTCDTQAELDGYWEKLTANGGKPVQCGWLKDRFGLSWQIVPSILPELMKDAEKRNRMMAALVQMVKLDIAKLKAAAEGR
jgi:predicted 3-demethylubiquinone-9 3-methyltransferase (glyoxalase superfamily)